MVEETDLPSAASIEEALKGWGSEIEEETKKKTKLRDPEKRKTFDICTPNDAKDKIIYILETTGDKKASEDEIRSLMDTVIHSCVTGSAKGAETVSKPKRKMSGWNCFLRWCSKKTERGFQECMTDESFKDKTYKEMKEFWNLKASEGCNVDKIGELKDIKE